MRALKSDHSRTAGLLHAGRMALLAAVAASPFLLLASTLQRQELRRINAECVPLLAAEPFSNRELALFLRRKCPARLLDEASE